MKTSSIIAAFLCAWGASTASAYSFKIKIDPRDSPEKEEVSLAVPKGAEAASARYFNLAKRTHPLLLAHGAAGDRDVEYAVRANERRTSIVLELVNRKNEPMTAALELVVKKPLPPVYRRVHRTADGKGWTTTAWQPPRDSSLSPWTVELAPNSVETVTIGLK